MLRTGESANLTCRMDRTVYTTLTNEADSQGISLNSLINSMVKKHLSWERFAEQIGFIPLSKKAVMRIFDNLDKETIRKIADDVGKTIPKEMLYLTSRDTSFSSITNFVAIWANRLGTVSVVHHDSKFTMTIHHGVGQNFSEYIAEIHKSMSKSLMFSLQVDEIGNNFVSLTIHR